MSYPWVIMMAAFKHLQVALVVIVLIYQCCSESTIWKKDEVAMRGDSDAELDSRYDRIMRVKKGTEFFMVPPVTYAGQQGDSDADLDSRYDRIMRVKKENRQ
ncbi:uncharacterized protein [Amphiura filiformis]|uniref:uncharacterized protein n=1 Tax=Amphiura filiformis TaxID=82378 RepID=UPI003B2278D7